MMPVIRRWQGRADMGRSLNCLSSVRCQLGWRRRLASHRIAFPTSFMFFTKTNSRRFARITGMWPRFQLEAGKKTGERNVFCGRLLTATLDVKELGVHRWDRLFRDCWGWSESIFNQKSHADPKNTQSYIFSKSSYVFFVVKWKICNTGVKTIPEMHKKMMKKAFKKTPASISQSKDWKAIQPSLISFAIACVLDFLICITKTLIANGQTPSIFIAALTARVHKKFVLESWFNEKCKNKHPGIKRSFNCIPSPSKQNIRPSISSILWTFSFTDPFDPFIWSPFGDLLRMRVSGSLEWLIFSWCLGLLINFQ